MLAATRAYYLCTAFTNGRSNRAPPCNNSRFPLLDVLFAEHVRAPLPSFQSLTVTRWPLPSNINNELEVILCPRYPDTTPSGTLMHIPREILFHIVCQVQSLYDYFSIARTSKSLFNVLMDTAILNRALKEMSNTPSGCLFWLRPVPEMPGDEENATPILSQWLTSYTISNSGALTTPLDPHNEGKTVGAADGNPTVISTILGSPFEDPSFPYIPFVRSCFESQSMKNRRRLWGQVKQMETIWRDYRAHGWKVDRFGVPIKA